MYYAIEYLYGKNRPAPGRERVRIRVFRTADDRDDWVWEGNPLVNDAGYRQAIDPDVASELSRQLKVPLPRSYEAEARSVA
ncbi:MAG TPA: hypothetical protein VLW45_09545 [Pelomicrobium sp.]|nr:hypothetical protein [Pelomicrobium sp.]